MFNRCTDDQQRRHNHLMATVVLKFEIPHLAQKTKKGTVGQRSNPLPYRYDGLKVNF